MNAYMMLRMSYRNRIIKKLAIIAAQVFLRKLLAQELMCYRLY